MQKHIVELSEKLGRSLIGKNWTVSCAESCTGGGIGYAITSVSGSSAWFNQGFITYSNEAKQQMVGVRAQTLRDYGAVSEQTVAEMAAGSAEKAQAQVGVAVSGIAGPDGGSTEKPVGTVWFGFFVDGKLATDVQVFAGDRHQVRELTVQHALQKLLQLIDQ